VRAVPADAVSEIDHPMRSRLSILAAAILG